MCEKYLESAIPKNEIRKVYLKGVTFTEAQKKDEVKSDLFMLETCFMFLRIQDRIDNLPGYFEKLELTEALKDIWLLIDYSNEYIEKSAPWTLSKNGKIEELKIVIVTLCEVLKFVGQVVWPFMPSTGEAILSQLGISKKPNELPFELPPFGFFEKGGKIKKGASLFPRIEIEKKK